MRTKGHILGSGGVSRVQRRNAASPCPAKTGSGSARRWQSDEGQAPPSAPQGGAHTAAVYIWPRVVFATHVALIVKGFLIAQRRIRNRDVDGPKTRRGRRPGVVDKRPARQASLRDRVRIERLAVPDLLL